MLVVKESAEANRCLEDVGAESEDVCYLGVLAGNGCRAWLLDPANGPRSGKTLGLTWRSRRTEIVNLRPLNVILQTPKTLRQPKT